MSCIFYKVKSVRNLCSIPLFCSFILSRLICWLHIISQKSSLKRHHMSSADHHFYLWVGRASESIFYKLAWRCHGWSSQGCIHSSTALQITSVSGSNVSRTDGQEGKGQSCIDAQAAWRKSRFRDVVWQSSLSG